MTTLLQAGKFSTTSVKSTLSRLRPGKGLLVWLIEPRPAENSTWLAPMPEPRANESFGQASNDSGPDLEFGEDKRCQFRLFQADRVSLNSTQFEGGDWRWQFCSPSGEILAQCVGYRSEAECRAAILRLQNEAAYATISTRG